MEENLKKEIIGKTQDLIKSPSVCPEAKKAGEAWLRSVDTPSEKAETAKFLQELSEDITSIDGLVGFASSKYAIEEMGEKNAKALKKHAEKIKKDGALYCDCPACAAALSILAKKDELLKD
jgi:hypothetical protein